MIEVAASIGIADAQIKALRKALGDVQKNLNREIATAVNATTRKVVTAAARELKKDLTVPVKILKKAIRTKYKASKNNPSAIVALWGGYPIPLKYFRATQTKSGVTYKIHPRHNRKSIDRKAFIAKQYNNNVYRRIDKARGPLEKVHGPSPGDSFEKAGIGKLVERIARDELPKQIDRRIRLLLLRASGQVPQRKK